MRIRLRQTWEEGFSPVEAKRNGHIIDRGKAGPGSLAIGWLFVITLGGAFIRLFDLAKKGLWYDEFNWLDWIDEPTWFEAIASVPPPHSPLFPALLWPFNFMLGSDYFVRFIPALLGISTIPIVFVLGRRMFGVMPGLCAAAFLALCPIHVDFSRQLQTYPLQVFNVSLACYFLYCAWEGGRRRYWWLASLFIALTAYAHVFGMVALGLFSLGLSTELAVKRRDYRKLVNLACAWAVALALYAPWLAYCTLSKELSVTHNAVGPDAEHVVSLFGRFLCHSCTVWVGSLGDGSTITFSVLVAIIVVVSGALFGAHRYGLHVVAALFLWVTSAVILFLFCRLWGYPSYGRYMMSSVPAIVLVLGLGTANLLGQFRRARILNRSCAAAGVLSAGFLLVWSLGIIVNDYAAPPFENWRDLTRFLEQEVEEEDILAISFDSQNARDMFGRYAPSLLNNRLIYQPRSGSFREIIPLVDSGKRVWYLSKGGEPRIPQEWLDSNTFEHVKIGDEAFVICFAPREGSDTSADAGLALALNRGAARLYRDGQGSILVALGMACEMAGPSVSEEAREHYERAILLDDWRRFINPKSWKLRRRLGHAYYRSRRYAEAAREYGASSALQRAQGLRLPWLVDGHKYSFVRLAEQQLVAGAAAQAILSYRQAYEVTHGEEVGWWLCVAQVHAGSSNLPKAIDECLDIIQEHPSFGPTHFFLGQCYKKQAANEKACEAFGRAAELVPGNVKYQRAFADCNSAENASPEK